MPKTTFRLVSHCCKDLEKTRKFYEEVLDFKSVEGRQVTSDTTSHYLGLTPPLKLNLVFLKKDGLILELQHFESHGSTPRPERPNNQAGLGFVSLQVDDLAALLAMVPDYGGEIMDETDIGNAVFLKDPDGQLVGLVGS
jgi:catechol 2,3-dioxygenase-like lactoylglutathione lyase family enzyme